MVRRRFPLATLTLTVVGLVAGGFWWWAVLRLALAPAEAGPVEGALAASGWGLSLLPVHVAASADRGGRRRSRRGGALWWARLGRGDGMSAAGRAVRR